MTPPQGAPLSPPKKGLEGIPEGLPPEEVERLQKLQSKLTDFVLHIIQAFLRTGYYTPDHPESVKAKAGLYEKFQSLFEHEDELAFMVRDDQEQKEVLIEGVLPEPQRLSRMMMKGMGELYIPKFVNYLERKDLISLTMKSRMDQMEFTQFIDLMSDPSFLDTHRKEDKDRFISALYRSGISHISLVFNEEMVLAPDRGMPWRARVTLSRMKKELKMIPYFQKMSGQELQVIRRRLLEDAIRPLRSHELIYSVIQNSDLAATPENREEVIEDVLVGFLPSLYIIGTTKVFLRDHLNLKKLQKRDHLQEKSDRLLKKFVARLKGTGTREGENLLEEFFRNQLVTIDDLTPSLKDKILLEKLTDKFLEYTEQFHQQLDQAKEKEKFITIASSFVKILPELIRRDRYPEVLRIITTFKQHFHKKMMWALLAGQVLEEIGKGPVPRMLEEKFLTAKKEVRAAILPIFAALEVGSIPHLLSILRKSQDQWVRKNACEALIQIGAAATVHLLNELEKQHSSVEMTCDILRVLGEIKSDQWKAPLIKILKKQVTHEHPKLREQALHTLCLIGGKAGEEIFLASLNDHSLEVQKRAVWCLGMIKSPPGAQKMVEILKQILQAPSPQTDQLEIQIYSALGLTGNVAVEGRTTEQVLIEILEKRGTKQWMGLFQKNPLSEMALETICTALGRIGTERSIKILGKLEKSCDETLLPKIKDALRKIQDRVNLSKA
ncbi:MAG: HEAT repeat domain-containing protein [Thermodesulfobacteriota bacterium]